MSRIFHKVIFISLLVEKQLTEICSVYFYRKVQKIKKKSYIEREKVWKSYIGSLSWLAAVEISLELFLKVIFRSLLQKYFLAWLNDPGKWELESCLKNFRFLLWYANAKLVLINPNWSEQKAKGGKRNFIEWVKNKMPTLPSFCHHR